jgi:integrase
VARSDGEALSRKDRNNWRKRRFGPAAQAIGIERLRPYDLGHSFCSLLIREGWARWKSRRRPGTRRR